MWDFVCVLVCMCAFILLIFLLFFINIPEVEDIQRFWHSLVARLSLWFFSFFPIKMDIINTISISVLTLEVVNG